MEESFECIAKCKMCNKSKTIHVLANTIAGAYTRLQKEHDVVNINVKVSNNLSGRLYACQDCKNIINKVTGISAVGAAVSDSAHRMTSVEANVQNVYDKLSEKIKDLEEKLESAEARLEERVEETLSQAQGSSYSPPKEGFIGFDSARNDALDSSWIWRDSDGHWHQFPLKNKDKRLLLL